MNHHIIALDITIENPPPDIGTILYPDWYEADTRRYIDSVLFYVTNYDAAITLETDTGLSVSFELGRIKFNDVKIARLIRRAPVSVSVSSDKKTAVFEFNKIADVDLADIIN